MTTTPGTIVVAVGGNALAPPGRRSTIGDQFAHTRASLGAVPALAAEGWHIAIVHGNGTQVGDELERGEASAEHLPPMPLGVLVASTAGWIGYMLQQSLQNALHARAIDREVVTLITQAVVRADDPRLVDASKPIGHVLDEAARRKLREAGYVVGQDAAGRWRRMVPSPVPTGVVEAPMVRRLVEDGKIVIAAGGGGTPVVWDDALGWEGVDAVVDKDRVAAVLGRTLRADVLLILTQVEAVYRGWGTEAQVPVRRLTLGEARAMLADETLGRGSMRPKMEAAVEFVEQGGQRAVIAHLEQGVEALAGQTGTTIVEDGST